MEVEKWGEEWADKLGMDFNFLMVSFLFGTVGAGMFMYGKKAGRMVPLGAGVGLMVVPYFLSSLVWMVVVCLGFCAVPFLVRE